MATPAQPIPLHAPRPAAQRRMPVEAAARFERLGPDGLTDEELLAAALGGGARALRRARRTLDKLGGVAGVARATPGELRAAGAGERAARALTVGVQLAWRLAARWPDPEWTVRTPADIGERLLDAMAPLEREELRVLLLDTKNVVTAQRTVYLGNLAGSSVRVGEVYREAVRACAASLVVVHNHPSGDPTPSAEDLRITTELAQAGRLLDIELLDHLVIGRGRWISLRAVGAIGQPPATTR